MRWIGAVLLTAGCITAGVLWAQQPASTPSPRDDVRTGLTTHSFQRKVTTPVGGKYLLYLPEHYGRNDAKLPLILFLHGSGERGNLNALRNFGPVRVSQQQRGFPFIVLAPLCPKGKWWTDVDVTQSVMALLETVSETYLVDPDRIYLTGLSMGGFGVWNLAEQYPDRWAALAPVCGGGNPYLAQRVRHIPTRIFHGQNDRSVPVGMAKQMAAVLKSVGGRVELFVYPDLGHQCWKPTYDNPKLYQWFLSHGRPGADNDAAGQG
jgi:predicted peptidase